MKRIRTRVGPDPVQQFLERHPRFAGRIGRTGNSAATAGLAAQAANADATTTESDFAAGSVPDNNGGTINTISRQLSAFPFFQTTLVRIDNTTQQPSWSYDSPGVITGMAIAPDNTVYATEVVDVGPEQGCCFVPTHSDVLALDGTTGQQKFNLPVPSGHVTITEVGFPFQPPVVQFLDIDTDAKLGLPSVLPDGSVNLLTYTVQFTDTFGSGFAGGCGSPAVICETAISDHKTLQLLTIRPDGSFSTQPVHAFDFVNNDCVPGVGCQDPSDTDENSLINAFTGEFVPGEVIPDGLGGVIAAWSGSGADLGAGSARVRHFDGSGGTVDYTVPLFSSQWSPPIATPKALILGENNVAFGSDGRSVAAFDGASGAQQWTFQPAGGLSLFASPGVALLASTSAGGVAVYTTDPNSGNANALLTFDSFGTSSSFPVTGTINNLSFLDASTLLATTSGGQGQLAAAIDLQPSEGVWFDPGGQSKQRRPVLPQITQLSRSRSLPSETLRILISGTGLTQIASIDAGSGVKVTLDNQDVGTFTATALGTTFTIDSTAAPGKHTLIATLKDGKTKVQSKQNFFVQIPTSLAGTNFAGQFDVIGTSGAGPLHAPSFGPNDFVFDASGMRVDIADKTPVCGVYRNYAFQLMDQDSPPQPISEEDIQITETLSVGPPRITTTNNAGEILDTHALVSPDQCLGQNVFSDIAQGFVASFAGQSATLTTTMHIVVGNVNGKLVETTEVTHP